MQTKELIRPVSCPVRLRLTFLYLALILTSCGFVTPLQQNADKLDTINKGTTPAAVVKLLGEPAAQGPDWMRYKLYETSSTGLFIFANFWLGAITFTYAWWVPTEFACCKQHEYNLQFKDSGFASWSKPTDGG